MSTAPLTFGGEETARRAAGAGFRPLTDLDQLAATIPDLVSAEKTDDRTLQCVVRPGFSFLRGTLRVTIVLGEIQRPDSATMHVAAKGIGTQIGIESQYPALPPILPARSSPGPPRSSN